MTFLYANVNITYLVDRGKTCYRYNEVDDKVDYGLCILYNSIYMQVIYISTDIGVIELYCYCLLLGLKSEGVSVNCIRPSGRIGQTMSTITEDYIVAQLNKNSLICKLTSRWIYIK